MIHFLSFNNQDIQSAKHTALMRSLQKRPRREEFIIEMSQLKLKRRWPRSLRSERLKASSDCDITVSAGREF